MFTEEEYKEFERLTNLEKEALPQDKIFFRMELKSWQSIFRMRKEKINAMIEEYEKRNG